MKLKLFKRRATAEVPVVDTRIDAHDHEFVRNLRQGNPMIPLRLAGLQKVPKWCHPGQAGKTIICPECGSDTRVYRFSWDALKCGGCSAEVEKSDWYLAASSEDEN
jgi:hypothetical protein